MADLELSSSESEELAPEHVSKRKRKARKANKLTQKRIKKEEVDVDTTENVQPTNEDQNDTKSPVEGLQNLQMETNRKRKSKIKKIEKEDKVKKPLNAFMLFNQETKAELKKDPAYHRRKSTEMNQEIGKMWQSLDDEEKQKYFDRTRSERKKKKEENKIKRPLNAFMLYLKEMRPKLLEDDDTYQILSSPELNSEIGKMWKELDDDERQRYLDMAHQERNLLDSPVKTVQEQNPVQKVLNAFNLFVIENANDPTLKEFEGAELKKQLGRRWRGLSQEEQQKYFGMAVKTEEDSEAPPVKKVRRKKRRINKENRPKKPLNPFILYSNELRPKMLEDPLYRDRPVTEINSEIGKMWRNLPSSEQKKYFDLAEKPKQEAKAIRDKIKEAHIKQPPNAYILFSHDIRPKLLEEEAYKDKLSVELNKEIGKIWRNQPDSVLKQYFEQARKLKQEHKVKYPNWRAVKNRVSKKKKIDA